MYSKRQDGMSRSDGMVSGLYCFVTMVQSRQLNTWSTVGICIGNKKMAESKMKVSFDTKGLLMV